MTANSEITEQILATWPDEEEPTDESEETTEEQPEEEVDAGGDTDENDSEETEPEGEAEVEQPEEDESEDEGEQDEGEEEETDTTVYASEDPEIRALLDRYGGDTEKALKGQLELQRVLTRQGQEKNQLASQVEALQQQLEQERSLSSVYVLSDEQRQWVEAAAESGNPRGYVQAALQAGEFDLARAVCDTIGAESPYDAMRLAQYIDQTEAVVAQQARAVEQQEVPVDHNALMGVLVQHFPSMPEYEQQMVSTLAQLGENHPLTVDARSNDPETAARGIIGIYEIARASTASVRGAREKVRQQQRQAADEVRTEAVVSSAGASPATGDAPRNRKLGPGLTLEALDAAWESK